MRKLYSYYRSSAAYRVRIALNLKGLAYDYVPIHLLNGGGQQLTEEYFRVNPQRLVPVLEDEGVIIPQSLAILEYLEERYPKQALLPEVLSARAWIRSITLGIACDMHPLQNLRVCKYLVHELGLDEKQKNAWIVHWIQTGFDALEIQLARFGQVGDFCYGDSPTFADICLIPQAYAAMRFSVSLEAYPTIQRIYDACLKLPAFASARPEAQIDYESTNQSPP
jgi:maleylpyruvate isomerase